MKLFLSIIFLLLSFQLVAETSDTRIAIQIPEKFKPLLLSEMRRNLEVVQGIVAALSKEDFEQVEKLASKLGRMDHSDELIQRRKLMPEGYKSLGPQMHRSFQAIARDARDFGGVEQTLEQLSILMSVCTTCHRTYRLEVTE